MQILLVDDDMIIRQGMRKIIEKSNRGFFVAAEAEDGEQALQALETIKVDVVITDMQMPILDGLGLISEIQKRQLPVKVVVLSGYDDFKYVHNAFVKGSVDYLLKPVNRDDLLNLLDTIKNQMEQECVSRQQRKQIDALFVAHELKKAFQSELSEEKQQQLQSMGIDLNEQYFVCDIRQNLSYKQKLEQDEVEERIKRRIRQVEQVADSIENCQVFWYREQMEVIAFWIGSAEYDLNKVGELLSRNLESETGHSVTVGISNIHVAEGALKTAYIEAKDAAEAGFYREQDSYICYEVLNVNYGKKEFAIEPIEKELAHFIELGDYINAKRVMENLFSNIKYLHPRQVKEQMNDLLKKLCIQVKDLKTALYNNESEYRLYIEHVRTYNELKAYMLYLLHVAIDYIQNEKKKGSQARIDMAKKYIHQHYMENITLNDLADHVELNPSYFSNLFKTETGTNFSDYLLEVRVDMAKKLLRDPKIKVYEVGNRVGYEDVVSFGRAFKKKIGMSPKEYRNAVYLVGED